MSLKKKHDDSVEKEQQERRGFLKKTAYAAPTLIAMGQLLRPTKTEATFGPPPSQPAGN